MRKHSNRGVNMELQYFKTDRNGTKYYYDWTCPRCGGAGFSDRWCFTGRVCYECGGTGKRSTPKIIKEYTPEYKIKLDEKRKAKSRANEPTAEERAEAARRHEEAKARAKVREFEQFGCGKNGKGFVYIGKTYKYKDAFRNAGGRWFNLYQLWVTPVFVEVDVSIRVVEIDIDELLEYSNGCYNNYKVHRFLDDLR